MTGNTKIEAGIQQMDFSMVDNGIVDLPTSTPATYTFKSPAEYDPDGFADEIESHDFGVMGITTEECTIGWYYYADVVTDHCKRVAVKVWPRTANIYPKEDLVDTYEFSRILHSIEDGFNGELEHSTND